MMLRNMLTSLVLYERIRTTKKRAQVLKPMVDKLITTAKTNRPDVAIRRMNTVVHDESACRKVMEVLLKRYTARTSGFTTVKAVGMRKGDGALLVDMMLIDADLDGVAAEAEAAKAPKTKKPAKTPKVKTSAAKA
jgi:large subunit ribosomal protein L17